MDENLTPMTQKELADTLRIFFAAMRASNEVRAARQGAHFADKLAEKLFMSGMRPFKTPPCGPPFRQPKP